VQASEFRLFLVFLRQDFEYFVMFKELDTSGDQRIGLDEFKKALPTLAKWGVKIDDPAAAFKEIDVNGGGQVLFDEFVVWATSKNLDLDDDDDNDCQQTLKETEAAKSLMKSKDAKSNSNKKVVKTQETPAKTTKMKVNWKEIHDKLPMGKTAADKKKRAVMFRQFDPNGNGYLSLAEIDKGIRDVLECESMFDAKPAIIRAFQSAKDAVKGKETDTVGDD